MNRLYAVLSPVVVSLYITAGNMTFFRPSLMRALSLTGMVLVGLALWSKSRTGDLSAIDKGFFAYIALNAIGFLLLPGYFRPFIGDFPTALLYALFFLLVAVPAARGRYFTEYFAKKTTPEAVWETDIFKAVNRHMTWAWAGIFVLATLAAVLPTLIDMEGSLFTGLFFQVILPGLLMAGLGIPLNRKYPSYYQQRMGIEPVTRVPPAHTAGAPAEAAHRTITEERAMDNAYKVVAINGSPHEGAGSTSQMLDMVRTALSREGVVLEEIILSGRHIEYCSGCGACLEKGSCWHGDDYRAIAEKLLAADGVIFASPVYFNHVTAQMKTFIDRSLAFGHKPRTSWKPGLAISVSAGKSETATAHYLATCLHTFGAFAVGTLTAIATSPGAFLGKDLVEARADDLARDLVRAIKEKRRYPATDENLSFYLFMRHLVTREKEFMKDDYRHWQEAGLLDSFEAYMHQQYAVPGYDPEVRKEWLKEMIRDSKAGKKQPESAHSPGAGSRAASFGTCRELLEAMPMGFKRDAAAGLSAVYQFEIAGSEEFTAHLRIEAGTCSFHEGPHGKPDVVIKSPAEVWLAVSRGEMDGQTAFVSGKYKVTGNMMLLLKLNSLFER